MESGNFGSAGCYLDTSRDGEGEASYYNNITPTITLEFGRERKPGMDTTGRFSFGYGSLSDTKNSDNSLSYEYIFASTSRGRTVQWSDNIYTYTGLGLGVGYYNMNGTLKMCCYIDYYDNSTIISGDNTYQQHPAKDQTLGSVYFEILTTISDLDLIFSWAQIMDLRALGEDLQSYGNEPPTIKKAYHYERLQVTTLKILYRL